MEDARDEKMLLVVAMVAVRLEPDALPELHKLRRWRMGLYFWDHSKQPERSDLKGTQCGVLSGP